MGKSAYDLAVENGFKGTVDEYLYSLRGKDGKSAYELACENGFRGSVKQWLRSLHGNTNAKTVVNVAAEDHENLKNLLGGNSEGHYHMTKEQYDWLVAQMSEKFPPKIADNQNVDTIRNQAMNPYKIQGENVR